MASAFPDVEERYLELPAARVRALERRGDPDRTVVFLHGITSSAATWTHQLTRLPDGMRGIAFDLLGSGYTERRSPRAPITRDDQRGLLIAVAEATGTERFRAVAHSMGCGPVLGAAWRHPELIEAMLLSSPATQGRRVFGATIRAARFAPAARLLELTAPLVVRLTTRARLRDIAGGRPSPELREREAGHALARPRQQVRGFVDIVGHGDVSQPSPESEHYRDVRQPVWILRGSEDRDWMPAEHEARYRDLMPDARLIRWNNVGHSPHIEAPERFASLVAEFIRATERQSRPPKRS